MKQNIKETGLAEVCEVITSRMGLHFPVDSWNLLTRNLTLAAAEFGFQHFDDFMHWLQSTDLERDQIQILASCLTVSESYFWREEPVFSALTGSVLPELLASKKKGEKNIRIWSAGCSSGEEPYSLAIALHRTIPDIQDWKIMISGTDLNPKALTKAKSGIYGNWSFRNCPDWLKTNYFHPLGHGKYEISPQIRNMVTFSNLNLTDDVFPSFTNNTAALDILFCRNVLMYMTDEWISKITGNFFQSLQPNGWFVVASCELSSQRFSQFRSLNFPGAIWYQKANQQIPLSEENPELNFASGIFLQKSKLVPVVPSSSSIDSNVLNSDFTMAEKDHPAIPEFEPEVVRGIEPIPAISIKIRLLAGRGELLEALLLCDEGIASDKLITGLYFLRASILQELNRPGEAIASLKKAIYLDSDFIMGHFTLGHLSLQEGKQQLAKKYFNNVLDLLKACNDDDILPESDGLSVKYMREIIRPGL